MNILTPYLLSVAAPPVVSPPISGYALWMDASQLSFSDGATVTTWPDLSGAPVTTTKVGTPVMRTTGMGGKPAVEMTAGAAFTFALPTSGKVAGTLFGVMRNLINPPTNPNATAHPLGFSVGGVSVFPFTDGKLYDANISGTRNSLAAPGGFSFTTPWSYARASNSTSSKVWLGGSVLFSNSDTFGLAASEALGINANNPAFFANCQVSEVIYYNTRLTDTDIATTLAYFHTKWGTT